MDVFECLPRGVVPNGVDADGIPPLDGDLEKPREFDVGRLGPESEEPLRDGVDELTSVEVQADHVAHDIDRRRTAELTTPPRSLVYG